MQQLPQLAEQAQGDTDGSLSAVLDWGDISAIICLR